MTNKRHRWTKEQEEFLKSNAPGTPYKQLLKMFNKEFGLNLTFGSMQRFMHRKGITNGRNTRFKNGHEPWNKGKKGLVIPGSEKGWFKPKGQNTLTLPLGSKRINKEIVEIKVGELPTVWQKYHHYLWERHYNEKLKDDEIVIFLDGNKRNFNLENLRKINRHTLGTMARYELFSNDSEKTETGILLAELISTTTILELSKGDVETYNECRKIAKRNGISNELFKKRIESGATPKEAALIPVGMFDKRKLL